MTAEMRSINSGPIRRALENLQLAVNGSGGGVTPPAGSTFVLDPAYVGPRRDALPTYAEFSHKDLPGPYGINVAPSGLVQAVAKESGFQVYVDNPAGVLNNIVQMRNNDANFYGLVYSRNDSALSNNWRTIRTDQYSAVASNYSIAISPEARMLLNVPAGQYGELRSANGTGQLTWGGAANCLIANTRYYGQSYSPTNAWTGADIAVGNGAGTFHAICISASGAGPQLRCYPAADGTGFAVVNSAGNAYDTMKGSAWVNASSATYKQRIRTLRKGRERIVVRKDPRSDTVDVPDIMALRPVVYRPKELATKLDEDGNTVLQDPTHIHGIEGNRERLGLIAQDVQHVIPSAVHHAADGEANGIDYSQITVALLDHVQELTRTIDTLNYRITELERAAA